MVEDSKGAEANNSEVVVSPTLTPVQVDNYDKRRRTLALTAIPLLLVASLIVTIPIALIFRTPNIAIQLAVGATIAAEVLALAFAIWIGKLTPIKEFFYLKVNKWWHIPLGFVAGILGYVILQLGAMGVGALTGDTVASSETSSQLGAMEGITGILFLVGVVAILGPLIEEFYFRGFIITSLQHSKWNKPWLAILISGLSFGIMHIQGFSSVTDIFVFTWTLIMGFSFAAMLLWSKSIWTPVAAHIAYNMVTAVLLISGFEG